jgi:hypothetical protein
MTIKQTQKLSATLHLSNMFSMMLTTKSKLVDLYKKETDSEVKERLPLVIRVREDGRIPFCVVMVMKRSDPWAGLAKKI